MFIYTVWKVCNTFFLSKVGIGYYMCKDDTMCLISTVYMCVALETAVGRRQRAFARVALGGCETPSRVLSPGVPRP